MDRRSLLKGLVGAPLAAAASNVIPFPARAALPLQPMDATLTALAALTYTNGQRVISLTGSDTFAWSNVGDPTR